MFIDNMKKFVQTALGDKSNDYTPQPRQKLSFLNILFVPFRMFYQNLKMFILLIVFFSVINTFVSFIFGNSIICNLRSLQVDSSKYFFRCASPYEIVPILGLFLELFVISVFIRNCCNHAIDKKNLVVTEILKPTLLDIKIFFILIAVIIINALPVLSFFLLQTREPNPDWHIESLYFALVSIGFIIPLISIFYYALIAFVIKKQKIESFSSVNGLIFSNGNKIFLSTLVLIFLAAFSITYYSASVTIYLLHNSVINTIFAEFMYNVVILATIAVLNNYIINLQENLLTIADSNRNKS